MHMHTHVHSTFWNQRLLGILGNFCFFILYFTGMTQNYLGTAATSQNATAFHWERWAPSSWILISEAGWRKGRSAVVCKTWGEGGRREWGCGEKRITARQLRREAEDSFSGTQRLIMVRKRELVTLVTSDTNYTVFLKFLCQLADTDDLLCVWGHCCHWRRAMCSCQIWIGISEW